MKKKSYKWVISCEITTIASSKKEAIENIESQLGVVDYEDNPEHIGSPMVEQYSKYNKFGKAKRVKFQEF